MADGRVTITFAYDEVLVLSDALHRWERDGTRNTLRFVDQAEQIVMGDLTATVEPVIDEVFNAD